MTRRKLWAFVKLTRPLFVLGGVLLYLLGIAIAAAQGVAIDPGRALLGQVIVASIQLMAHYANEHYDIDADRLNGHNRTLFSGGSGVLPIGDLDPQVAYRAMQVCVGIGLAGVGLATLHTPLMLIIGVASLLSSYFYSAPPLSLMGSGWGELSTSIIVALGVPLTGYVLQAARIDGAVLAVGLALAPIHMAMMITFEFPDFEADRAIGKQTLAVRLGRAWVARLHNGLLIAACLLMPTIAAWQELGTAARLVWLAAPLVVWQIVNVAWRTRHGWTHLTWLALGGVGVFGLVAGLWLIGFLVG